MFESCDKLSKIDSDTDGVVDLSALDISNISDANNMFVDCIGFTKLIGPGTESQPASFSSEGCELGRIFSNCYALEEVEFYRCDTSNVTSMNAMFAGCKNLIRINSDTDGVLDVSAFDMSSVNDARWMFCECDSMTKLIGPGTESRTASFSPAGCRMDYFCNGCDALEEVVLSCCDTSHVTDTKSMFDACGNLSAFIYLNLM